jgi:hypothetical protein
VLTSLVLQEELDFKPKDNGKMPTWRCLVYESTPLCQRTGRDAQAAARTKPGRWVPRYADVDARSSSNLDYKGTILNGLPVCTGREVARVRRWRRGTFSRDTEIPSFSQFSACSSPFSGRLSCTCTTSHNWKVHRWNVTSISRRRQPSGVMLIETHGSSESASVR